MPARQKLSQASLNGALLIAGLIGLATESWIAFLGFTAGFILIGLYVGDVRLSKRSRNKSDSR